MVFPSPISSARITLLHLKTKKKKEQFCTCSSNEVIKTNDCTYLNRTCTMSEPTSSSHPADNLSAEGYRLRCMAVVSSAQQTSAFASTPEIIRTKCFIKQRSDSNIKHGRRDRFGSFGTHFYLAVFRGDGFTGVSVHEAVDAGLKLLLNQSSIFPAAL